MKYSQKFSKLLNQLFKKLRKAGTLSKIIAYLLGSRGRRNSGLLD